MNINIFGSTGIIGSKTLNIITKHFSNLEINLLCANNNVTKLISQIQIYKPSYVYLNNHLKINILKKNISKKTRILNYIELISYLKTSKSDLSILAISGYKSLNYLEFIINNTSSLGIVSKEAIVSAGHLFKSFKKSHKAKIYPLDSEHFSIYKNMININNNSNLKNITLTASGGPFLGKKFLSLKNISFEKACNHPKWKMGYKNSIDSATLVNKCLEVIEAHYLFDIPLEKIKIIIHPESQIHSIFEFKNYIYNMIAFQNDMNIPIFHFLNQNFNKELNQDKYSLKREQKLNFHDVKFDQFPVYKFFNNLDKSKPSNIIKFNVANEFAVNQFKNKNIKYTDIPYLIEKISSLNLNYNLKTIKDIIIYHEILEIKINEKYNYL